MAKSENKPTLTPKEIRSIREDLGLTQVEAGELLGGGPRAFTKYERGETSPAASIISLLRVLQADPSKLATLTGKASRPISDSGHGPLEATGEHIAVLSDRAFVHLLRKLLSAEAQAAGLPAYGMHVAGSITTADGGEDGRISWTGGPESTDYLPARLSMFQLKAGSIGPAEAAKDVLTKTGEVKDMVREVLEHGGVYTMLCAHRYVLKAVSSREEKLRQALRDAGLQIDDNQVAFREADQIADWVNHHPSVVAWLLEKTCPGLVQPFHSWTHWAGRSEHDMLSWVDDERLPPVRTRLRELVGSPTGVARVVGYAGVGKSRLVLEALNSSAEEEASGQSLADIVMYAIESEAGPLAIKTTVQNLADSGLCAIVVVDRCPPETHRELEAMVRRQGSRLSLVSIDNEIPVSLASTTIQIAEASEMVTEEVIKQILPNLPSEDLRRLVRFCKGYPSMAALVGRGWNKMVPLAHTPDEDLVDAVVLGRNLHDEPATVLRVAEVVSVFGMVWIESPMDRQLDEVAALGRKLDVDDMRFALQKLGQRGVAQKRGRTVVIRPRPVALHLAERQWRRWSQSQWDSVLAGEIDPYLKVLAARQLTLLNTTDTARKVARHICRFGGPMDDLEKLSKDRQAEVLSELAEIDTEIVTRLIEHVLEGTDLQTVSGDVRRHLVWALEKITFDAKTFEQGARLLLRLAVYENEGIANNATEQFKDLFPVILGNTAADAQSRLRVLQEATETDDAAQKAIVVEALVMGIKLDNFTRTVGSESHGSRPALEPWHPKTQCDVRDYVEGCLALLGAVALKDDAPGAKARKGIGDNLRSLVLYGLIDAVEPVVVEVCDRFGSRWPEARKSLSDTLDYNAKTLRESLGDDLDYDAGTLDTEVVERVRALLGRLQPDTLAGRVCFLITEMPWDYPGGRNLPYEKRGELQEEAIKALVAELHSQPEALATFLPQLTRGQQQKTRDFGKALAEIATKPLHWLHAVELATTKAPDNERNLDLLVGYVSGLYLRLPANAETFKLQVAASPQLAAALPSICLLGGITASDVSLVISALRSNLLTAGAISLWSMGGVLAHVQTSDIAPLFDVIFELDAETYAVGLQLLSMYCYRDTSKLDGLRPQVKKAAEYAGKWSGSRASQVMDKHYFEQIMGWMLDKGRHDQDASATALLLARGFVDTDENRHESLFESVVPLLLSGFPEVVWPLIGQAIVSDPVKRRFFEVFLGARDSSWGYAEAAIMNLPEDTLFAWCHAHPDIAPSFVATIVPFLSPGYAASADPFLKVKVREANAIEDIAVSPTPVFDEATDTSIHPIVQRLLNEFGDRDDVLSNLGRFLYVYNWNGSLTTYHSLFEKPLEGLREHQFSKVRRWAKSMLHRLSEAYEGARNADAERGAYRDF